MDSFHVIFRPFIYIALAVGCVFLITQLCASSTDDLYEPGRLEKKAKVQIERFVKKYNGGSFTYISDGDFNPVQSTDAMGIWVTAKTKEKIESGRSLIVAFTNAYLTLLQSNKEITEWYANTCKRHPQLYTAPISLKNVQVRIVFWDENVERPQDPYLAEITFYRGKFQYYKADPKTQATQLVFEETYEDAVKLAKPVETK